MLSAEMSTMAVQRKHAHERVSFGVRSGTTFIPVAFTVTTIAAPLPGFDEDGVYWTYDPQFTANVYIPNIPGISNQIQCGMLRDAQFTARKSVGSTTLQCKSPASGLWPEAFMPDTSSTTTTPSPARPPMSAGASNGTYYTWTFGPDKPAIGISPGYLPSTSYVSDMTNFRDFLFVQFGSAAPSGVAQVNCSFLRTFWGTFDSTGKTVDLTLQTQLSNAFPAVGQTLIGGTVINEPVQHQDTSPSAANAWLTSKTPSHWLPYSQ